MRSIIGSVEGEYHRYKALGEGALAQLADAEPSQPGPGGGNGVAVIVWHLSGNLASRFTDFLTSDGEKPWRQREDEFAARTVTRQELTEKWEEGWRILFEALAELSDEDLHRTVTIRGIRLPVHAALHRSLAHVSYHVGQIVFLARAFRGDAWTFLSIPPGGSDAYNRNPAYDKPNAHADRLTRGDDRA